MLPATLSKQRNTAAVRSSTVADGAGGALAVAGKAKLECTPLTAAPLFPQASPVASDSIDTHNHEREHQGSNVEQDWLSIKLPCRLLGRK